MTAILISALLLLLAIISLTDGGCRLALVYAHGFINALVLAVKLGSTKHNGMYGLRHSLFNLELPLKTFWFNMGYWDADTLDQPYAKACERLVAKVFALARPSNHTRPINVVDVGYGCGDSCFFMAEKYDCRVTGITNECSQWSLSKTRLERQYPHLVDKVQLIQGSATAMSNLLDARHFDAIVSIDSAYHYDTRWDFLREAQHFLAPGGSVALFDLTLDDSALKHLWWMKHFFRLAGIPPENMVTPKEYKERLLALGYTDVNVTEESPRLVFGGLSQSIKGQMARATEIDLLPTLSSQYAFMRSSAAFFHFLSTTTLIIPVLVSARMSK